MLESGPDSLGLLGRKYRKVSVTALHKSSSTLVAPLSSTTTTYRGDLSTYRINHGGEVQEEVVKLLLARVHTVNDSRPASIAQERKEHVEAGLTKITLDAFTAFVDKLTTYNTQLASTPYKQEGALDVIAILDAMAAVDGDFVSTFKITNVAILTDFDKTYDLLKKLLEERDCTVAKTAATEERRALIARKETPPPALEREVTALRAELTRIGNLITGDPRTIGAFAATRGGERTTCADCNGFHRGPRKP